MSHVEEIFTLQFGNYSNYIGSHFWNIQENDFSYGNNAETSEICHDVLYRQGINYNKEVTYTPRLLLVDLVGSLKHLSLEGELYADIPHYDDKSHLKKLKDDVQWISSDVDLITESQYPKHELQMDLNNPNINIHDKEYNLADSVETWSDFLYSRFHPRSVNVIREYSHDPSKQTFDTFSCGVQLWYTNKFQDDFCNRIRQYVEECDFLQGFQIIFDGFNGFTGLASQCLEHLNDEFHKSSFVLPIYSPKHIYKDADEPVMDSMRIVNSALMISHLTENASLFIPLSTLDSIWRNLGNSRSFDKLHFKHDNFYQTSSILAAYLDTISLSYRLKNTISFSSLFNFCCDLNNNGRNMAAGALSLPFPMTSDIDLIDCLDKFEGSLFTQLTPNCSIGRNYVIQNVNVRGIPVHRLKRPCKEAKHQSRLAAYRCQSIPEMFYLYLQCAYHKSKSNVSSIQTPMSTKLPFPNEIFDDNLNKTGFLNVFNKREPRQKIKSVPTLAAVQSSKDLSDMLDSLHHEAKRIKIAKLHRYRTTGLEDDNYVEALEKILFFKDNYDDKFQI